jgi:rare lipoprotein A
MSTTCSQASRFWPRRDVDAPSEYGNKDTGTARVSQRTGKEIRAQIRAHRPEHTTEGSNNVWKYMLISLLCLDACASAGTTKNVAEQVKAEPPAPTKTVEGKASFYGGWRNGRRTSSGRIFNSSQMTAAHPTLPFGTTVLVTNMVNSRSCNVEITDRGPARWTHRVIDVSEEAARCLEMIQSGVVPVTLKFAGLPQ